MKIEHSPDGRSLVRIPWAEAVPEFLKGVACGRTLLIDGVPYVVMQVGEDDPRVDPGNVVTAYVEKIELDACHQPSEPRWSPGDVVETKRTFDGKPLALRVIGVKTDKSYDVAAEGDKEARDPVPWAVLDADHWSFIRSTNRPEPRRGISL